MQLAPLFGITTEVALHGTHKAGTANHSIFNFSVFFQQNSPPTIALKMMKWWSYNVVRKEQNCLVLVKSVRDLFSLLWKMHHHVTKFEMKYSESNPWPHRWCICSCVQIKGRKDLRNKSKELHLAQVSANWSDIHAIQTAGKMIASSLLFQLYNYMLSSKLKCAEKRCHLFADEYADAKDSPSMEDSKRSCKCVFRVHIN